MDLWVVAFERDRARIYCGGGSVRLRLLEDIVSPPGKRSRAPLIRLVAKRLCAARERESYRRLAVVGDELSLDLLRDALDPLTAKRIVAELPRDSTEPPLVSSLA